MPKIMYDWECEYCGNIFEDLIDTDITIITCSKCGGNSHRVIIKPRGVELKYNPKTDICDWSGNTTQYYRQYNEAKDRGENVRLPEEGE